MRRFPGDENRPSHLNKRKENTTNYQPTMIYDTHQFFFFRRLLKIEAPRTAIAVKAYGYKDPYQKREAL
jgi:hypothetical protein